VKGSAHYQLIQKHKHPFLGGRTFQQNGTQEE
jgi:hypothetical protein